MVRWWGRAKARSRGKSKENEQEWEQEVLIPSDSAGNPRARPIRPGIFFFFLSFLWLLFFENGWKRYVVGEGGEGWGGGVEG